MLAIEPVCMKQTLDFVDSILIITYISKQKQAATSNDSENHFFVSFFCTNPLGYSPQLPYFSGYNG